MRSPSARRSANRFVVSARIAVDVVELRTRRVDDLVAARSQRAKVAPAVVVQRIHRFGVRVEAELALRAGHQRDEADAGNARRAAAPSRSSTVGITSTDRTGSATRRCRGQAERRADRRTARG